MSIQISGLSNQPAFYIPKHIAITMDGNGRWGRQQGFSRSKGHYEGAKTMEKVIDSCLEFGVEIVTLYAFSSENWSRPNEEVNYLMNLPIRFFKQKLPIFMKKGIQIIVSGDLSTVPRNTREVLRRAIEKTKNNDRITVNFAFNYGGRDEILRAAQQIIQDVQNNEINIEDINEQLFTNYLYTSNLPDPELFIRTGGEKRMSNFLLWQAASAELYFTDIYFPDFDKKHLLQALYEFNRRKQAQANESFYDTRKQVY
ncbi:MAG TPA: isoprenyl transferase [Bacillota bacterium]|nr:isoprenyl transferase [Bacillota bacterium]